MLPRHLVVFYIVFSDHTTNNAKNNNTLYTCSPCPIQVGDEQLLDDGVTKGTNVIRNFDSFLTSAGLK